MCSTALLCDTSWTPKEDLVQGSRKFTPDIPYGNENDADPSEVTEAFHQAIDSEDPNENTAMLLHGEVDDEVVDKSTSSPQHVARQDSGVPDEISSPKNESVEEDPDGTMNSDCNVTVIHVTLDKPGKIDGIEMVSMPQETQDNEASPLHSTPESKDSKDGSDSGVDGCIGEIPRVEYASSCNGLDEVSCDSSLVSCCSVYEDPCAIMPEDSRMQTIHTSTASGGVGGGEGTSEGGSESSSVAGSVGGPRSGRTSSAKRSSFASSNSSNVSASVGKRKTDSGSSKSSSAQSSSTNDHAASRSLATPRGKIRSNVPSTPRTPSSGRTPSSNVSSRDRGRSREGRSAARDNSATPGTSINTDRRGSASMKFRTSGTPMGAPNSANSRTRTRPLPDSLPSVLTTEIDRDLAAQRGRSATGSSRSRGGSCSSRGRGSTPGSTPSEDGRKSLISSSNVNNTSRNLYNARNDRTSGLDDKALETYATLPRTRNKSNFSMVKSMDRADEINGVTKNDSRSASRDASLSRLTAAKKPRMPSSRDSVSLRKCLPPYPRAKTAEKTRIYHETSVQTGLTCEDIENALAGVAVRQHDPEVRERLEAHSQTEGTWEELRDVQNQLKIVTAEANQLRKDNEKAESEKTKLERLLAEERADHAFARQELDKNARRVLAMLGTPQSEQAEGSDSFLELETHFQSSGQVVANQQIEIADLQSLCRMLNRDLEKSLAAQKALLQQQQELEVESTEMQDFLQAEKSTLAEALKDAEVEIATKDELLALRDMELARLTEECKHLVRMSEQRRQENLSLGMKLNAVERRSRELLLGQGAAVSGAAVALSGLGTRLDGLVDQLVRSYKISEKDLEDVVYHNEAYSRSNSSAESSPVSSKHSLKECTPSPKRGSFVSAVIGAIRNAANHPFAAKTTADKKPSPVESSKHLFKELSTDSSSDLLDFETEPCLMMESVLEDVPLPDTYSHNMVSSSDSLRRALSVPEPIDEMNSRLPRLSDESTSLNNLTQAILNRRKAEDEEDIDDCDSPSESECIGGGGTESNSTTAIGDYCPAVNLVDQVIDVDNLVTKLLKVLRIIQLDNDTCIRDLRDDKSELESKLEAHSSELEELRKLAENFYNSDEIFADAIDDRRRTIVENRKESVDSETSIEKSLDDENNSPCKIQADGVQT